jgi:hypothetical protein
MRVVILASLVLIGFTACKKKELKKVEKAVTEGTWKITRFIDSGDDETASYASATLTFNEDGTLILTHGNTYSGTWIWILIFLFLFRTNRYRMIGTSKAIRIPKLS